MQLALSSLDFFNKIQKKIASVGGAVALVFVVLLVDKIQKKIARGKSRSGEPLKVYVRNKIQKKIAR